MRGESKPAKKRAYHHGDLARALVGAAAGLLERKGPDALTLREVAAAVGVTHGAAYRHFEDKTALLAAIAEAGFRDLAAVVEQALAKVHGDPVDRLHTIADAYVGFAIDHRARYGVMFGPRLNEDGRFPTLEEAISAIVSGMVTEIRAGQERGLIRPGRTRDIGLSIWVFAHGYVELVHRRRIKVKNRAVTLEYFHVLFDPVLRALHP